MESERGVRVEVNVEATVWEAVGAMAVVGGNGKGLGRDRSKCNGSGWVG